MICDIDLDNLDYESETSSVVYNDKYAENENNNYSSALSFISSKNSFSDNSYADSYINSYIDSSNNSYINNNAMDKNYSRSYDVNIIYTNSGKRQRSGTIDSDVIHGYSYNENYLHMENIHIKNISNIKNRLVSFKKKNTKLKYKLVLHEMKINKIIEENQILKIKLIYNHVLDELLKNNFEIRNNKLIYSTIIEDINRLKIYNFGKMYLNFINSL